MLLSEYCKYFNSNDDRVKNIGKWLRIIFHESKYQDIYRELHVSITYYFLVTLKLGEEQKQLLFYQSFLSTSNIN